jgi:hypothetical protein
MIGISFKSEIISRHNQMTLTNNKFLWIILLLLFIYTQKRYDIDDHYEMRYNNYLTRDLIL